METPSITGEISEQELTELVKECIKKKVKETLQIDIKNEDITMYYQNTVTGHYDRGTAKNNASVYYKIEK